MAKVMLGISITLYTIGSGLGRRHPVSDQFAQRSLILQPCLQRS